MTQADAPDAARGLILIRTHFVDDRIVEMFRRFGAGGDYDVMVAVDETAGPIESSGLPKLSMTLDSCVRLGLNVAFEQPMWRCGDYLFYHALALKQGYDRYWSIEYDIALNFCDPLEFFRFFDRKADEEYLSTFLEVAGSEWPWRASAERRFPVVYASGFALVRLSARAVARLFERRRFEAARLAEARLDAERHWPNDETFVSSAAPEMGMSMADLNKYGEFYSPKTLMRGGVWHPAQLPAPNGKIYHAVRTGAAYLRSVNSYYEFDLRDFFTWADRDLPEFGDVAARVLATRLAKISDDPAAVFGPEGALDEIASQFQEPRVAAALLRAFARQRMRLCLEAVQFGRIATPMARTQAFDNVALGRSAWQSSFSRRSGARDPRRDAEGGNDGNRETEYGFHTGYQDKPWWAVDLGAETLVRLIRLFNRPQAEHKLSGFEVATSLDFVTWTTFYAHSPKERGMLFERPIEVTADPPVCARYVRVQLMRRGVLHLAEIEVLKA